jgi:acetoin:2,6-dichlorophenolindophenol oxidoreductase subunit beta
MSRPLRYLQALNEAIALEMEADDDVFIIGEDIRENLRGETRGLAARFGNERVLDAPISEQAFAGYAIGAAMDSMRPIVELQIPSLVYMAFDQMVNQAVKLPYMMGGQARLPITYLVMAAGNRPGIAGQHSDNPYTLLAHAGLKVVCPASPEDVKGLASAAIRDNDPVALFAPAPILGMRGDVREERYSIPLGAGRTWRHGDDVTIAAIGHLVHDALAVADELQNRGIEAEVWDPRTLWPLDTDGLLASLQRTRRLAVLDDTASFCGYAAELAAIAAEELGPRLRSRVARVARRNVPIPFSSPLEQAALPSRDALVTAITRMVDGSGTP